MYILLQLLLLALTYADITQCPSQSSKCNNHLVDQGVCAYDTNNNPIAFYNNQCVACSYTGILGFVSGSCPEWISCPSDNLCLQCRNTYSPVCATDNNRQVWQTFSNLCQACITNGVSGYYQGVCQNQATSGPTPCPSPRPQVCFDYVQKTCGIPIYKVNCINPKCGQQYPNACYACRDPSIGSTQLGDC